MSYDEDYFRVLLEATDGGNKIDDDVPWWVKKLILVKQLNKAAGGFKQVYLYKDMAVGVYEKRYQNESDDPLFLKKKMQIDYLENTYEGTRLKEEEELKRMINKNIVYPTQEYEKWGYVFLKMKGCYERELFDILYDSRRNQVKTGLEDDHFLELMKTLSYLHGKNIFLGDIKPENIMLCERNHLSFIDTDNIIYMRRPEGYFSDFHHTDWYSFLSLVETPKHDIVYDTEEYRNWMGQRKTRKVFKEGFRKRDIELNDWVALSICLLMNYDTNIYVEKEGVWGYGSYTYPAYTERRNKPHYKNIGISSRMTKLQDLCARLIKMAHYYGWYRNLRQPYYDDDVLPVLEELKNYVQETAIDMNIFNSSIRSNVKKEKLRKGVDEDKWKLTRKRRLKRRGGKFSKSDDKAQRRRRADEERRGGRKEQDEEDLQLKF